MIAFILHTYCFLLSLTFIWETKFQDDLARDFSEKPAPDILQFSFDSYFTGKKIKREQKTKKTRLMMLSFIYIYVYSIIFNTCTHKNDKKWINGKCLINSVKLVLFDASISPDNYKSLSLHWFLKKKKIKSLQCDLYNIHWIFKLYKQRKMVFKVHKFHSCTFWNL